jgi:hypothetical protein
MVRLQQPEPAVGGESGPVPPDNQPGHHPEKEQDKPDPAAFAARLGADPKAPPATAARKAAARPKSAPARKAPTAQPESAPTPQEAAHISAPQPEPEEQEPRLVGLVLLPLRQSVKGLELLDRTLTARLSRKLQARGGRGPRGR